MKGLLFVLSCLLLSCAPSQQSSCPLGGDDHAHCHHLHHTDFAEAETRDDSIIADNHDHHHHDHHRCHQTPSDHGSQLPDHDHDDLRHQGQHHSLDREHQIHRLAEEIAEEEELELYGFKSHAHGGYKHIIDDGMPLLGLWVQALGCSLLVSMASLICLILLPLIVAQGKPSRMVVDSLAAFGAGAMLGDAFLHQLPHALGSSGGHSHSHGEDHGHMHHHAGHDHHNNLGFGGSEHAPAGSHGHGHSIRDLSVGLAVLAGIIAFFIVEKIVRQLEKSSSNDMLSWVHHHHHHHGHGHDHDRQHLKQGANENDAGRQESLLENEMTEKEHDQDHQLNEKNSTTADSPFEGEKINPEKSSIRKRMTKRVAKQDEATSEMDACDVKETDASMPESWSENEMVEKEDVCDHQRIEKNINIANGPSEGEKTYPQKSPIQKRLKIGGAKADQATSEMDVSDGKLNFSVNRQGLGSNLILGYLNLFSDGVHNFTDGMALGSAFINRGAVGGWSSTIFLLAHELPQEVGDFGILVQSGFTVGKALGFNFLSALMALAGTSIALLMGGSPGHSSLIEGFTAGGFVYIAVAGVLPEMHQNGSSLQITMLQLFSLSLGMSSALLISLLE